MSKLFESYDVIRIVKNRKRRKIAETLNLIATIATLINLLLFGLFSLYYGRNHIIGREIVATLPLAIISCINVIITYCMDLKEVVSDSSITYMLRFFILTVSGIFILLSILHLTV